MNDAINDADAAALSKALGAEESDIKYAMIELFKDNFNNERTKHDTDLRTRLLQKEVRSLSIISFLQSISFSEAPNVGICKQSLADGLDELAVSLKRHKISLNGKSREEIVELFKSQLENEQKKGGFFNRMFQPTP